MILRFQIHQIPIRDWNAIDGIAGSNANDPFQIHQIPIRDWNSSHVPLTHIVSKFQIHQIPIRDWNLEAKRH